MSKSPVKKLPDGMHSVTPHIVCAGAADAIEFYKRAFGAVEAVRLPGPGGKLVHAMVLIENSPVMLVDENPDWGLLGPKALNGTPVTIHLYVADTDATFKRAIDAGATARMEPHDAFWGDRYGVVEDPFGHHWSIGTHQRDLTVEQISEAMSGMSA